MVKNHRKNSLKKARFHCTTHTKKEEIFLDLDFHPGKEVVKAGEDSKCGDVCTHPVIVVVGRGGGGRIVEVLILWLTGHLDIEKETNLSQDFCTIDNFFSLFGVVLGMSKCLNFLKVRLDKFLGGVSMEKSGNTCVGVASAFDRDTGGEEGLE